MARPVDAEALEKKISEWLGQPGNGDYYSGYDAALCAVQDLIADTPTLTPPNEALTLEQLREMDGEPVWVKCLKPDKYTYPPVGWRILETAITGNFGVWNGDCVLIERDYGTDWLAYRRPPEVSP